MRPKFILVSLHQIQSISPLEPLKPADKKKQKSVSQSKTVNTTLFSVDKTGESQDNNIQKILRDLQRLNEKERQQAFKLLREEADTPCIDSDDIGNVTECHMKIQLKDQTPVQKTYYSMPKPLHPEVKDYIEDLLNKSWIKNITLLFTNCCGEVFDFDAFSSF